MAKEYVLFISSHAVQMIYGSCDKKRYDKGRSLS